MKRILLLVLGALALACLLASRASAQDFPSRPITLVVGYSSGGTDLQYRKLAQLASKHLGQQVVVENKPGANGTLGLATMARTAKPDGYTIAASTITILRQPHLQETDWHPLKDFTWIIGLGGYSFAVAVREDSPFKTLADMINWAKANPGKLTYASSGVGSSLHLLMEDLAAHAGFEPLHVPYKGGAEINTAMLGGQTMVGVTGVGSVINLVEAKKVRLLAVFDEGRLRKLPEVPTAKEQGYNIVYPSAYGIVGPRGMPEPVVKRLHDAFKLAMDDPENRDFLERFDMLYWYRSSDEYRKWAEKAFIEERAFLQRAGVLQK
jgi:tripartite-type tricarboxylate transporter receptor subunit TctC